jgi:hypothetical protein|nr:hypothetical protein [Colwellia sp. BRX8-7]
MSKPKPNNQIVAGSGTSTAPQPWCPMILIVAANVTVLVAEKHHYNFDLYLSSIHYNKYT